MAMKLVIRQSSGDQFEVEVPTTATVLELKQACEKTVNLAPEAQRLIFKGRILKDEQTLESHKIEDGVTVHLVKAKTTGGAEPSAQTASNTAAASDAQPNAAQANPFGFGGAGMPGMGGMGGMPGMGGMGGMPGMGGMGGMPGMGGGMPDMAQMQSMMQNPMVQQMLSNPQFMEQMINSNPMLQQMT